MQLTNSEMLLVLNSVLAVAVLGGIVRMLVDWGRIQGSIEHLVESIEDLRMRVLRLEERIMK